MYVQKNQVYDVRRFQIEVDFPSSEYSDLGHSSGLGYSVCLKDFTVDMKIKHAHVVSVADPVRFRSGSYLSEQTRSDPFPDHA
jgi:hypothetical protein